MIKEAVHHAMTTYITRRECFASGTTTQLKRKQITMWKTESLQKSPPKQCRMLGVIGTSVGFQ